MLVAREMITCCTKQTRFINCNLFNDYEKSGPSSTQFYKISQLVGSVQFQVTFSLDSILISRRQKLDKLSNLDERKTDLNDRHFRSIRLDSGIQICPSFQSKCLHSGTDCLGNDDFPINKSCLSIRYDTGT